MPFVINPLSGESIKVTKAQKEAYDTHKSSELLKAFVSSQFGIPTLGVISVVVVGGAFGAFLLSKGWDFSKPLKDAWDEFKSTISLEALSDPTGWIL